MKTFTLTRLEFEALEDINRNFVDHYNLKLVKIDRLEFGNGTYTGYAKDTDQFLDGYDYLRNLTDGFDLKQAWAKSEISDMYYYLILNLAQRFGVAL